MATAQDLDRVVEGQVGYVEKGGRDGKSGNLTKFGAAYGLDGYAWCSMFVWWCFKQVGIDVRQTVTGAYASAEGAMEGFAKHGWKITKSPRFMDVVFFHFPGEHAGANHTGFVISADAGGVHTIEGNTSSGDGGSQVNGGGVYRRYRPYSVIIGYGRYPLQGGSPVVPRPAPVGPGKKYPTLTVGSHGAAVTRMQTLLHITADGNFGPKTKAAVERFQKSRHLAVDGIAGPATLKALGY